MTTERILIATEKDIPALNNLVNSAYRGDSSRKGWTTEADLLKGLRTNPDALLQMMKEPGSVILKYSAQEKELSGCVYLRKKSNTLYLGMLTVQPLLQTKGIGKQLLAAAENYAKKQNCHSITMTVISVRKELIAWYERRGYHATGETEPFPANPEFGLPDYPLYFIVMQKELA